MELWNYIQENRVDLPKHILGIGRKDSQDIDLDDDYLLGRDHINYIIGLADKLKDESNIDELFAMYPNVAKTIRRAKIKMHFEQASTRTSDSFEDAITDLGIGRSKSGPNETSVEKGESLYHTVRMYNNKKDILVFRGDYDLLFHLNEDYRGDYDEKKHLKREQLKNLNVRIINAGDEKQHPTQTLLDLAVMMKKAKVKDVRDLDMNVAFVGPTQGYRAAQSLMMALNKYTNCKVSNIVPADGEPMNVEWGLKNVVKLEEYAFPKVKDEDLCKNKEIIYKPSTDGSDTPVPVEWIKSARKQYLEQVAEAIKDADILYFCRPLEGKEQSIVYGITPEFVEKYAKGTMQIMHPLPIGNNELSYSFDDSKWDLYLEEQPIAGYDIRKSLIFAMLTEKYWKEIFNDKEISNLPMFAGY